MPDSLLRMGRAGRAHGIKGEIGVDWRGEFTPEPGDEIYLQAGDGKPRPMRILSRRIHKDRLLLGLEGIDDRSKAESLTGMTILVSRDAIPPPEEDEAFAEDLPGCDVYLPDGSFLGKLDGVDFPAGQMIWTIMDSANSEILFPADPGFINSLDMENRRVVIDPPPGLLEIYRA